MAILSVKFVYIFKFYSTKLFSCEHHNIFTKFNLFNNNSNLFAVIRLNKKQAIHHQQVYSCH